VMTAVWSWYISKPFKSLYRCDKWVHFFWCSVSLSRYWDVAGSVEIQHRTQKSQRLSNFCKWKKFINVISNFIQNFS
jgi:hypothetical protein